METILNTTENLKPSTSYRSQTENTPLLEDDGGGDSPKPLNTSQFKRKRRSPYLVLPVIFGSNAASSILATTVVEVLRKTVCLLWYFFNDPDSLPPSEDGSGELCRIPPVEKLYATVVTFGTILESVAALIAFALIGKYAGIYGRRYSLLVIGFIPVLSTAAIIIGVTVHNTILKVVFLALYTLLGSFAGPKGITLLGSLFVLDTTDGPADRTAFLTLITASAMTAMTSGYGIGGVITRRTQKDVTVLIISLVISVVVVLYDFFVLPETFNPSASYLNSAIGSVTRKTNGWATSNISRSLSLFLKPFAHIKPARRFNGTHNYRLLILAMVTFFTYGGIVYVIPAFLLYGTTALRLKADETGAILSTMTFSQVIFMLCILPTILTLRSRFSGRSDRSATGGDPEVTFEELRDSSPSTRFDLLLLFFSLVIYCLAVAGIGAATSKIQLTIAMIVSAFGAGAQPILNSLVAASCEPSKNGEVVSAIQMVGAIAEIIALVGLGAVMTTTISTTPTLVFWLAAGLLMIAGMLLSFVKDSDRWDEPSCTDPNAPASDL